MNTKPSKKHAAAVYEIARKAEWGQAIEIPTRYNAYRLDPMENYIKQHAVAYKIEKSKDQTLIMFQDAEGGNISGYFLRPDQVDYVIERILG